MTTPQPGSPQAGILFDVDGTLVDTNYLHTLAWSRAFTDAGAWAPMHAIHRLIGMGGDNLVPRLLGHPCPRAVAARAGHYRELIGEARAFPGAKSLVALAHEHGLRTAIATSAPADELDRLIDLLDIAGCLGATTTADDVETSKPDPEVFVTAMRVAGLEPDRTFAIGDSVWDVEAARAAGIACIGVESGGFSRHELDEAGALHVYRNVEELLEQFHTSPLALLLT